MTIPNQKHTSVASGALLVAAILASASVASQGAILNGNFASADWVKAGDATALNGGYHGMNLPSGATQQAVMTTITSGDGPTASGTSAVVPTTVDTTLGLFANTINSKVTGQDATSVTVASGMAQTFAANAGDKLSFQWNFITGEEGYGSDFAFYTLHPAGTSSSLTVLTSSSPVLLPANSDAAFVRGTGWSTPLQLTIPSAGNWTLGFGVADANPLTWNDSALGVANVSFTAVPEPWAWSMMTALALGGLAVARRIRQQRA